MAEVVIQLVQSSNKYAYLYLGIWFFIMNQADVAFGMIGALTVNSKTASVIYTVGSVGMLVGFVFFYFIHRKYPDKEHKTLYLSILFLSILAVFIISFSDSPYVLSVCLSLIYVAIGYIGGKAFMELHKEKIRGQRIGKMTGTTLSLSLAMNLLCGFLVHYFVSYRMEILMFFIGLSFGLLLLEGFRQREDLPFSQENQSSPEHSIIHGKDRSFFLLIALSAILCFMISSSDTIIIKGILAKGARCLFGRRPPICPDYIWQGFWPITKMENILR